MVERERTERGATPHACMRRECGNHRRERGNRTEEDCSAKRAIHAAHDAYGVALPLSHVKVANSNVSEPAPGQAATAVILCRRYAFVRTGR